MDLSKDNIISIIEFLIEEDGITPDVFEKISKHKRSSIEEFNKQIRTTRRVFDLYVSDVDFIFHLYLDNYDLIKSGNLTENNIKLPQEKNFNIVTECTFHKSGYEYYRYKEKLFSINSLWWLYDTGNFYPNDGELIDEEETHYEMDNWDLSKFEEIKDLKESIENVSESREELKKLFMMKELVDKKIKELL
jgi:hypothetical protein